MKYFCLLLLIAGLAAFSGCTLPSARNIENSKQLRVGMPKNRVLEIMGEPLTEEEYNTPDVWYYYIQTVWVDGLTTRDECMPIVFEEGKVVGWGNRFYTQYRSSGVRNAREINLTGEPAEKTPQEAERETMDDPAKEKRLPAANMFPESEIKKSAKVQQNKKAEPEVKKSVEAKPVEKVQTEEKKPEKTKDFITVDDLVKEMDSKK